MDDALRVQGWRWRLNQNRPPISTATRVGGAARAALMSRASRLGQQSLPDVFHHGGDDPSHPHAFYLSEDEDGDGQIDHVLVYTSAGITEDWIVQALTQVEALIIDRVHIPLSPDWMGRRAAGGLFGPAREWRGLTPYVTPKWRLTSTGKERPRFTPEAQLRDEIKKRGGLPEIVSIHWSPCAWAGEQLAFANAFELPRGRNRPPSTWRGLNSPPKDAVAAFPTIVFSEPAWGPLAFGFGAHLGLGLLVPLS